VQFLYPIGFIALASLLLPIFIHLWRVKQGKTLKIGSISLLGESAAANARNLKISEWLLLLLRCLFFLLIALLIAQPYFKGKALPQNKAGWILVHKKDLKPIYLNHQKTIDSLLKKGYQLRDFGLGFKPLNLKDTAGNALLKDSIVVPLSYTSLLKQANQELPSQYPIWIFAPKYSAQLDDVLPTLHLEINWQSVAVADTSSLRYTEFLNQTYKAALQKHTITYSLASEKSKLPLHVMVYPSHTEDAKYVKAALSAIGSYLNQPMQFHDKAEGKKLDVLIWLSTMEIPSQVSSQLKNEGVFLKYANSAAIKKHSSLILGEDKNTFSTLKIRNTEVDNPTAEVIWRDGFGNAILTVEKKNKHYNYLVYTQFNLQWTDLIWSADFAPALIPILYHQQPEGFAFKQTQQIDQTQPVAIYQDVKLRKTMYAADKPANQMIWVLAFITLLFERMLSFRTKKLKGEK